MAYTIRAKHGSIFDEKYATYIVNPSNTRLLLGSGVSGAFLHECSKVLQEQMHRALLGIEDIKQGDVVATSAGESKKFAIALHVVVMNYDQGVKQLDSYPTLQTISHALQNIELYLQWYAKHKSPTMKIVLPMIGCGVGRLPIQEVALMYKKFFAKDVEYDCEVIIYNLDAKNHEVVNAILCN